MVIVHGQGLLSQTGQEASRENLDMPGHFVIFSGNLQWLLLPILGLTDSRENVPHFSIPISFWNDLHNVPIWLCTVWVT